MDRLFEVPAILDGELERIRAARGMGLVPPAFLLDKAIAQMEASIAGATNSYVGPLVAAETDGAERSTPVVARFVAAGIVPALERQLAELRLQRAVATDNAGMWAQPIGEEYCSWAVSASTTTAMTPDEIHRQGLAELDEIHGRMDPILREIGYTKGSIGDRMQALSNDPRYKFAEGDPGREEIFAFINDRVAWIRSQMPRAFNQLVDPPLEVRRLPLTEEPGAPGAYGGAGSKDGSIPGRFWINLHTTDLHRKYDLADLAYHESIPGHVWEGEFSNRLPLIRSILAFNAFSEGWALLPMLLADELGADWRIQGRAAGLSASPRLPRLPLGGRYGPALQTLDPRTGAAVLRRAQWFEGGGSGERGRSLLQLAGAGLRLQDRPQRNRPPARTGTDGTGRGLRLQGVQHRRGAGRECPAQRAGQHCQPLYCRGEGLTPTCILRRRYRLH